MCALVACGGNDNERANTQPVIERPTPNGRLENQTAELNRALTHKSCQDYQELVHSFASGRPPGVPSKPGECKGDSAYQDLLNKRMDFAQQIGTGGVLEGTVKGKRSYTVWALDVDGEFRFLNVSGGGPKELGSRFTRRDEAREVAEDFLKAVRDKDCAAMEPLLSPKGSRLVVNLRSKRKACQAVLKGDFLAPALRATPNPEIEVLGGTANLAFVGIATRRVYFTMILGDGRRGALRVFDVVASSPVKFPRR